MARKPDPQPRETDQNPHRSSDAEGPHLERTIGRQVKKFRLELGLTMQNLGRAAGVSVGMLSKIENGQISPSLSTLKALSEALNVPLTALFRGYERDGHAVFVKGGEGLKIERRGTRAGHQYQLLGHSPDGSVTVEPYLVTLRADSDVFPLFQHDGLEFIYLLEGEVVYRHGATLYDMKPGDSLFFDATINHGPEQLVKLPIKLLSVISYPRGG